MYAILFTTQEAASNSKFCVQIVQLTALRPTADQFCIYLRDALKSQLQRGQMKAMKAFVKTCYSEELLSSGATAEAEQDKSASNATEGEPSDEKAKEAGPTFHGGLGLQFKFPGDPKKYLALPS